ncbi:MAG: arylsulfatase [Opitutales bacterium]|nr:arylsulfatase [Opitutales bacterium]
MISKPHFFIASFLAILFSVQSASTESRPNIVLVMVDDMGWSSIGCYGGMVETPTIDRLAKNGVRFNQFYNGARCCPTRATLMTGLHPHQVGIGHMTLPVKSAVDPKPGDATSAFALLEADRSEVPASYQGWLNTDIPTLPEMLKSAGYATYMTGKWHLASEQSETWPLQRGFDRFYGHLAGTSHFFVPANLHRGNQRIQAEGERYYITDAISKQAIEYLKVHDRTKDEVPFFLYLAYNAPHFPLQCMPEDYEKYKGRYLEGWDILRVQRLAKQKRMGIVPESTQLAPRTENIPAWDSLRAEKQVEMDAIMATYAAMIDRVDQNLGKLVSHLEASGELDNTLILFLSDNGGEAESGAFGRFNYAELGKYGSGGNKYGKGWASLSNTPFREYKHYAHQGGVQSPLIAHWPKGISSKLNSSILEQPSYLPDLVETCLDIGTASRPELKNGKSVPKGEGVSLVKTLKGSSDRIHEKAFFIEHEGNRIARDGNWKLVSYYDNSWELYDLDEDRSESNDLAERRPEIVKRMDQAYSKWAKRSGVVDWNIAKDYNVYDAIKRKASQ